MNFTVAPDARYVPNRGQARSPRGANAAARRRSRNRLIKGGELLAPDHSNCRVNECPDQYCPFNERFDPSHQTQD